MNWLSVSLKNLNINLNINYNNFLHIKHTIIFFSFSNDNKIYLFNFHLIKISSRMTRTETAVALAYISALMRPLVCHTLYLQCYSPLEQCTRIGRVAPPRRKIGTYTWSTLQADWPNSLFYPTICIDGTNQTDAVPIIPFSSFQSSVTLLRANL